MVIASQLTSATRVPLLVQKISLGAASRPKNVACGPRTTEICWLYRQPQGQGEHAMKSVARLAFLAAVGLCASSAVALADTFDLTSCHISGSTCQGGSIPAPGFGSVTLTQAGANVNFTVTLINGNRFVETGAGGGSLFLFNDNIAGSTITTIATSPTTPAGGL